MYTEIQGDFQCQIIKFIANTINHNTQLRVVLVTTNGFCLVWQSRLLLAVVHIIVPRLYLFPLPYYFRVGGKFSINYNQLYYMYTFHNLF